MNIAIGTRHGQGQRLAPRSIFMAIGGVLALTLAVGIGAVAFNNKDTTGVDPTAAQRARLEAIMARPPTESPDLVFYIVGSEAQRDVVEGRLAEAGWIAVDGNFIPSHVRNEVLLASDPAQEAAAAQTIGESSSAGATVGNKIEVYDLRNK